MPRVISLAIRSCLAAALAVFAACGAQAQSTMSKLGTPGWYRMQLGSFEITALSDGTLDLPVDQLFPKVDPERIRSKVELSEVAVYRDRRMRRLLPSAIVLRRRRTDTKRNRQFRSIPRSFTARRQTCS